MNSVTAVGVHEAKTHFSELLRRVAAGEEIEIRSSGRPVARLVPITTRSRRVLGVDAGRFEIPAEFDEPLPADVLSTFE